MNNNHPIRLIPSLVFLLWIGSHAAAYSQNAPAILWQHTIGGSEGDELLSIQKTADGGYILGGYSNSDISGDKTENSNGMWDYWIVKTDSMGNILWQNTIGGDDADELFAIQQTADGGYILGGFSESTISGDKTEPCLGGADYWVVKTDSSGNVQWENTIGGSLGDLLYAMVQTSDGGFICGGASLSNISGDKTENNWDSISFSSDYWIVKLDPSGNIQWQNTIGGNGMDILFIILQTKDGGYVLGGFSDSGISGDKTENSNGSYDCWIVKTDSLGNILWQHTIGGTDYESLYSMLQTADGGYLLGASSSSGVSGDKTQICKGINDFWIIKLDSLGTIQWQQTIGGAGSDGIRSLYQTSDGGYLLGGYSNSNISGDKTENSLGSYDYWVVKTDSIGNIEWQNTIGGSKEDYLYSVQQTSDGGYLVGGSSLSNISGDKTENTNGLQDYWIIKLAPDTVTGIFPTLSGQGKAVVTPNPMRTTARILFPNPLKENFRFELYNGMGTILGETTISEESLEIERGGNPAGIYFFRLINGNGRERMAGKIMMAE